MDFSVDFWLFSLLLLVLTFFGNQIGTGWLLNPWVDLGYRKSERWRKNEWYRQRKWFPFFPTCLVLVFGFVLLTFLFQSTVFFAQIRVQSVTS